MSNRNLGQPQVGSKVRLVGLKNPDLNGKKGSINGFSSNGERVMVALSGGGTLVKVKPKQIELMEDPQSGSGGRPGLQRGGGGPSQKSLRSRSASQDRGMHRSSMNGSSQRNLHRSMNGSSQRDLNNRSSVRRNSASDRFYDNASQSSEDQEVMETLRSADAMFDLADTSGDGLISQKEFEHYMRKHTDHHLEMIRECFYMIDVDHNGDITRDEVRNAFLKKRRELKGDVGTESERGFEEELLAVSRDADRLFQEADIDGNGFISISEFELYMKRHTKHSNKVIHKLFDSMDEDGDGFISREEVRRAYLNNKEKGGEKTTLADLLGVDDDDMAEIEDDVYNMFFLSTNFSPAFWFAIAVFGLKLGLIIIIAMDLFDTGEFPEYTPPLVKAAQFLLLPVNVSVQEELITTFFIYANLKWSKHILELNPGATKTKYHIANLMRLLDGLAFLFINTTLLLQAQQVISAFLNFAALQFLSSIDNVALHLARDGYLTESLETVAGNVLLFKLPRNHNEKLQVLDTILLMTTYLIQLIAWILLIFVM